MLLDMSKTIKSLARDSIVNTEERIERELDNFFNPVITSLMVSKNWGENGSISGFQPEELNPVFMPVLKSFTQISSMLIANDSGCEYMLLESDSANWINRTTFQDGKIKEVRKHEWKFTQADTIYKTAIWEEKKDYDPRIRPWYKIATQSSYQNIPVWTDPYIFATTKDPGVTASIKWFGPGSSDTNVIAYDIMLTDISKFTSQLHVSNNGMAFILSHNGEIIGLPKNERFLILDSLKANVLKLPGEIQIPLLDTIFCKGSLDNGQDFFSFRFDHDVWWASLKKYEFNREDYLIIGVAVPERDYLAQIKQTRNTILIGFGLVIILTVVMVYSFLQKRKANLLLEKKNAEILQQKEEIETQRDEIEAKRDQLEIRNQEILQAKEEIETQRDQLEIQNEKLYQAKEEIEAQRDEIEAQRDQVMLQYDVISEQNREITDSIHYAKRIQNAILPTPEFRQKLLKEHFILFKPLNIVSGDFYWMASLENRTIVVTADCTGHGVPGAFMSMLGAAFLNEIINKEYITHTGVILRRLRKQVIDALQQKGAEMEQKDGMDIVICSIDFSTMTLQFSGANNPLYIIRQKSMPAINIAVELYKTQDLEDYILYEIRPDNMPIAIHVKMDKFATHEIKLEQEDSLYMFSDGFADQFGGPKGKKFMYKHFKELLLSIQKKSMNEQAEILDQTIEDWKSYTDNHSGKKFEQIDDISVLGIKI
jgi:serine phosphatase RsbU (regulator of sigma subunit)